MATIGIFDSGVGGLSLAGVCEEAFPGHGIVYVADTAHQPYGQKTSEQVLQYSRSICEYFRSHNVDVILVACSTASAVAVESLQRMFRIPIVGLLNEEWADDCLGQTHNGRIGILATTLTTRNGAFAKVLEAKAWSDVRIFGQAAPALIDRISEGRVEETDLLPVLRQELEPLLDLGVDTLVVGCTHFNFILPQLQRIAGPDVRIVNPRDWAVQAVKDYLGAGRLPKEQDHRYYVTGGVEEFQSLARKLWRPDARFEHLELAYAAQ